MICDEAQKKVDELVDGSLVGRQREDFERHLLGCPECRSYLEWVRWLSAAARALPGLDPPKDLWPGVSKELSVISRAPVLSFADCAPVRFRSDSFSGGSPSGIRSRGLAQAAALFFILLALSSALILMSGHQGPQDETGWSVSWRPADGFEGTENITGRLDVGQSMETDSRSTAHIDIASIGHVEVRPNSRVRLVESRESEQRMALERGRIKALILAPPRLFFVETPSALAVDLGCAYELSVDDEGNGKLEVTSGWVALEYRGLESLVPAGAVCTSRRGRGPGTPHFPDAAPDLQAALARIDSGSGGREALETVLDGARLRDTLSLWHLFSRVEPAARPILFERLAGLVKAPDGVTKEGISRLDPTMLALWKDELEIHWW